MGLPEQMMVHFDVPELTDEHLGDVDISVSAMFHTDPEAGSWLEKVTGSMAFVLEDADTEYAVPVNEDHILAMIGGEREAANLELMGLACEAARQIAVENGYEAAQ